MKQAEVECPIMLPGDSSMPSGSILCGEELRCRPSRPPDYEKENAALVALGSALADSPRTILQKLTETIREITQSDSAGVSLLMSDEKVGQRFYWPAITGMWNQYVRGGLPRDFAPCGAVIDRNCTLLFTEVAELYPILRPVLPAPEQLLCVPFYIGGRAVGTIWAVMHTDRRMFDAEDDRVMGSLGKFASSAYQVVTSLDALEERDEALRQSCEELEQRVKERTAKLSALNQELRDSEEQWKAAFESNPVMYFMVDRMGTVLSVNAFGADQLGYKRSELVGTSILDVFYEADREQVQKHLENCFQNLGRTFKWEVRKVRKDRTVIWVRETANALLLKNRPVLLVVCEDITDRKRAEDAVRRSEKELRDLIETIPAIVFAKRPDGSSEFVSQQWKKYSGLSPEQTDGDGWKTILHPDDREEHVAKWQESWNKGEPFESEARHRHADGNYRWLLVRAVPLRSEQGKILKWYGTAIDIEDRKRTEEALRASEQLARSHVEVMMRSLDVLATEAAPEKFIAEMLRTIGQRLHACSVLLWLRDPQDGSVHLRLVLDDGRQVAPHMDHPFVKDPHSWKRVLPFQEMLFTKGPVVCDDIERDSRIGAELRDYLMKRGRRRFLAIPMFVLGEVRGFIGIQHVERGAYRPEEIELAQALAHHVMIAVHEAELAEQRRHAVILGERTRMARDIHDTLAQGFTGVLMQLEAVASAISRNDSEKVNKCLQRASDSARRSLSEARRSVHALRPQSLQEHNFWDALKDTIKNTTAGTALHTTFAAKGKLPNLPELWQENLLRIGQEALTNTLKHAHARKFETRLNFKAKELRLELQDDGNGFKVRDRHHGVGLTGMRERVEQMGGALKVTSARGRGTKVAVVLPCNGESMP